MKIIEKQFNVQTGEETITERDETAEETKARLDRAAEIAVAQAEVKAKADQKAALLAKLGITDDEAKLLLL
jgi:small ligand-binding sensory domain FIST